MSAPFDLDRIGGGQALLRLLDAVLAAGDEALRRQPSVRQAMQLKADRSPVTAVDCWVEEQLRQHCQQHFPQAMVIGEEDGVSGPAAAGLRWLLDPIDGTRAFVRDLPTWSVLLGLEDAGTPVIGIAYLPALRELYVGVLGQGATVNSRPLHVSSTASLADATISHGSLQQFTDDGRGELLTELATKTFTQRGFADFDGYRYLLSGRVDAMIDPGVKPWDICAAALLVHEAGGRLTSLSGEETLYGDGCVASNGLLHAELLALLNEA